jgi:hypothetical protein
MIFKVRVRDFSQEDIEILKRIKAKKDNKMMQLFFKSYTSSKTITDLQICAELPHKPEPGTNIYDALQWLREAVNKHTQAGIGKHHRSCTTYRIIEENERSAYIAKEHVVSGKQTKLAGYTFN